MTREELFDYLDDEDLNFHGLDPIATHGFLTASVVGKPMPNWLAVYFEVDDASEVAVSDDIKSALIAWRDEIEATLKDEAPVELPFDADDEEEDFGEDSDVSAWAFGFVMAMYGDEDIDWFDNEDTEEDVAELTLPMVILSGIDEDNEDMEAMRADTDMMAQLANSLEDNVTELYLLFHTND
ncbi:MAG: YecA family protein [Moraxella sp.]|nr:YecA family protein [Moraxella sp.]